MLLCFSCCFALQFFFAFFALQVFFAFFALQVLFAFKADLRRSRFSSPHLSVDRVSTELSPPLLALRTAEARVTL